MPESYLSEHLDRDGGNLIQRESVPGRLTLLPPSQDKRLDLAMVTGPRAA